MSDPRVPRVLAHAEYCREAFRQGVNRPFLLDNLKDLSHIDLSDANLARANLTNADLTDANLTSAELHYVDLTGANLRGARGYDANLTGADLTGANLTGANFTDASFFGAKIGFADLTNTKITQKQLKDALYVDVAKDGYPKEVAEKVILLHESKEDSLGRKAKKRLVVELLADGKLHIKTPIFKY